MSVSFDDPAAGRYNNAIHQVRDAAGHVDHGAVRKTRADDLQPNRQAVGVIPAGTIWTASGRGVPLTMIRRASTSAW
jgi:hypothetical protein